MSALAFDCCEMAAGDKTVGFTPKRGEPARALADLLPASAALPVPGLSSS